MPAEPGAAFLNRPQGDKAVVIGGGHARPEQAARVVLQTGDGRVLVRSVRHEANGAFAGEVYAVMPRERAAKVGDRVRFSESQIFAFKTAEAGAKDEAASEIEQMTRSFEASFSQLDTDVAIDQSASAASRASSDTAAFDIDISAVLSDLPAPPPAAVHAETGRSQSAAKPFKPREKNVALSTAEAVSILRAAEEHGATLQRGRVDPVLAEPTPATTPVVAKPPPPVKPLV